MSKVSPSGGKPNIPKFDKDDKGRVAKIAHYYGKDLFAGHQINWTQLGSSWGQQIKNFIRSYLDKDYAQTVRNEFLKYWENTLETPEHLHHLSKISDEDIPKIKKMELIIKAAGKKDAFKNLKPLGEETTYYDTAISHFNQERDMSLSNIYKAFLNIKNNIHELNNAEHKSLERIKDSYYEKKIQSEDELNTLKINYAKDLFSKTVELIGNNTTNLDTLKLNIDNFLNDSHIGLSGNDKKLLKAEFNELIDHKDFQIKTTQLLADMEEDGYLTPDEKNEFLKNEETKKITDYYKFEYELNRQYPGTYYQEAYNKTQ